MAARNVRILRFVLIALAISASPIRAIPPGPSDAGVSLVQAAHPSRMILRNRIAQSGRLSMIGRLRDEFANSSIVRGQWHHRQRLREEQGAFIRDRLAAGASTPGHPLRC